MNARGSDYSEPTSCSGPGAQQVRKDFRNERLLGADFRNTDLSGADFEGADLRGADFTGACLKNVSFRSATLGSGQVVRIGQSIAMSTLGVVFSGIATYVLFTTVAYTFSGTTGPRLFAELVPSFLVAGLCSKFARNGFTARFASEMLMPFLLIFAVCAAVGLMLVGPNPTGRALALAVAVAGSGAAGLAGAVAAATASSGNRLLAFFVPTLGAAAGILLGHLQVLSSVIGRAPRFGSDVDVVAVIASLGATVFELGVLHSVELRREGFEIFGMFSSRVLSLGGTQFAEADCTGATFEGTRLAGVSFKRANLTRVRWRSATQFHHAVITDDVLAQRSAEYLAFTGKCKGEPLARVDLHGLDLSGADLRDADLTESNLTGSDLTGVHLTGACLESWNIDSRTILKNIDCDFVYLKRIPLNGDRARRPADLGRNFRQGEFEQLYRCVLQGVDVVLENKLLPEEASKAFRAFAEEQPGAWISSLESRGGSIVAGLTLAKETPEAAANAERSLLRNWDREIIEAEKRVLQECNKDLVRIAIEAQKPTIKLGLRVDMNNNNTNRTRMDRCTVATVNGNVENANQTLYASSPSESLTGNLQDLLYRLKADSGLSEEEKGVAEDQVGNIFKAIEHPADSEAHKAARVAFSCLKGLASGLGDVSKIVIGCEEVYKAVKQLHPF